MGFQPQLDPLAVGEFDPEPSATAPVQRQRQLGA
jgi:hypothetical protein